MTDYSDEVARLPWPEPLTGEEVHDFTCPKCSGTSAIHFPHHEIPEDTWAAISAPGAVGQCPCGGVFQVDPAEAARILGHPGEVHGGHQLGASAGAGAGEPDRGDDLAYETVFGWLTDDPENSMCIVCGADLDLNEIPDPNTLLCPDCRGRADHHDKKD